MTHLYSELYLNKAESSLAMALDFALHQLHQDAGSFFDLFISTGTAAEFERGEVQIIAGMSGVELAYEVLGRSGIPAARIGYRYMQGRSREYWAGHALARYQWEQAIPFSKIIKHISLTDILKIVGDIRDREIKELSEGLSWMDTLVVPDHMSEDGYAVFAFELSNSISYIFPEIENNCDKSPGVSSTNEKNSTGNLPVRIHRTASGNGDTNLKRIRTLCGLSQSGLAAASGIPVRTIQQYEQRQKDINKASFESIIKLAAVLNCEPYSLFEINTQ